MIVTTPNTQERKRSVHDLDEDLSFLFQKRSCMTNLVPDFECNAFYQGQVVDIRLSNLLEQYNSVVLFFYERDFTANSLRDVEQVREHYDEFAAKNSLPIMISTDTAMVHRGFCSTEAQGGLSYQPEFPMLGDTTRLITRHFDVLNNDTGNARRSVFVIDHHHKVKYSFMPLDSEQPFSMPVILSIAGNVV
ncbi:unnamed protein product [Absidia cylindrospora]